MWLAVIRFIMHIYFFYIRYGAKVIKIYVNDFFTHSCLKNDKTEKRVLNKTKSNFC